MKIKETKIALKNAGQINPDSIDDYLNAGGYKAAEKALKDSPVAIIDAMIDAKLRGRGGAGFSTGLKNRFTNEAVCERCVQKYIVCNADEGEPGTFKDRIIMEQDPHLLIEGMLIAAYAIGATKGYIYIRGEYVPSIEKVQKAIDSAYEKGLLGKALFDSEFKLDLEIRLGAGSYLCGEELTLLESLEGKRGYPRIKPPFPAQKGLFGKPTLINNVETFAHIPYIVENGAEAYKRTGTENSPGTKIFTISGDVRNPGYYETEMGVTLGEIINDLAGGMKDGKKFQAAILGGAAGTFVDGSILDVPMGFDTLKEKGAVLGSGAIIVMDETRSLRDMLLSIMDFFKHESCGKCVPCRVGMVQIVKMMQNGLAGKDLLDKIYEEADYMAKTSLCPLGQSPIIPIRSMKKFFYNRF